MRFRLVVTLILNLPTQKYFHSLSIQHLSLTHLIGPKRFSFSVMSKQYYFTASNCQINMATSNKLLMFKLFTSILTKQLTILQK